MNNWKVITGIILTLGAIVTLFFKLDAHVAKVSDIKEVKVLIAMNSQSIEGQSLDTRIRHLEEKLWRWDDKFCDGACKKPYPEIIREDYRDTLKKLRQRKEDLRMLGR